MCSNNLISVSNQGWVFFPSSCALSYLCSIWWWVPAPDSLRYTLPFLLLAVTASRLFWCITSIIQHNWLFIISTHPFYVFPRLSLLLSGTKSSLSPFLLTSFWGKKTHQANISLGLSSIPSLSFISLKGQSRISLEENEEKQVYPTFWLYG